MRILLDEKQRTVGVASNGNPNSLPVLTDNHKENLKGVNTYNFQVPANHEDAKHVTVNNHVIVRDLDKNYNLFTIKNVKENNKKGEYVKEAMAELTAVPELLGDVVRPQSFNSITLESVVNTILSNSPYWSAGKIEYAGVKDISFDEPVTVLEALNIIADEFEVEMSFNVTLKGTRLNLKEVNLTKKRGQDTGYRFEYGVNTEGVERTEDSTRVITALVAYGKGDTDGNRLSIADYPSEYDDEEGFRFRFGNDYIENVPARQRWGRNNKHIFGVLVDDEADTVQKLFDNAMKELKKRIKPLLKYKVEAISLERLSGYEGHKVRIGDTIKVIDKTFKPELYLEARVIEVVRSYVDETQDKIVLGEFEKVAVSERKALKQLQEAISLKEAKWDENEEIYKQPSQPTSPEVNDIWIDTSNSDTEVNKIYRYDSNFGWVKASPSLANEIRYSDDTPVEDLKPASAGADVTGDNTANDVQTGAGKAVKESGADVTGNNTASDVQTGVGKAVKESGADVTGNNTANDTSNVNGRSASLVDDDAKKGKQADTDLDDNQNFDRTGNKIVYNSGSGLDEKEPNEAGADKTSNNTANDTTNVNGRGSSLVDNDAKAGKNAKDSLDGNSNYDYVNGRVIFTTGETVDDLKPASAGADVTGDNTAYDTSRVDGRSATTVRDESRKGKNADDDLTNNANFDRANNDIRYSDGNRVDDLQPNEAGSDNTASNPQNLEWTNGNDTKSTVIPSAETGAWYRIAMNAGNRAFAKFIVRDTTSSNHGTVVFTAGVVYNREDKADFTIQSFSEYGTFSISDARIITGDTYDEQYLELWVRTDADRSPELQFWITENIQATGWDAVDWSAGSIPSTHSAIQYPINKSKVVDVTGDNTSADTAKVDGETASNVRSNAGKGATADTDLNNNIHFDRSGNKIRYSDGNDIDTLQPNEGGADVTGNNTADDTSKVNGRSASTIKDESRKGSDAKDRIDNEVGSTNTIETTEGASSKASTAQSNAEGYTDDNAVLTEGIKTSNTSSTDAGNWTKFAEVVATTQYNSAFTTLEFVGGEDGGDKGRFATLFLRLKQQGALGTEPYVNLQVREAFIISEDDFKAVMTQNDSNQTKVEVYVRINSSYERYSFSPMKTRGKGYFTFFEKDGFVSSLPAGIKHYSCSAEAKVEDILGSQDKAETEAGKAEKNATDFFQKNSLRYEGSWDIPAGGSESFVFPPIPDKFHEYLSIRLYQYDLETAFNIAINGTEFVPSINAPNAVNAWVEFDIPEAEIDSVNDNTITISRDSGSADAGNLYTVEIEFDSKAYVDRWSHPNDTTVIDGGKIATESMTWDKGFGGTLGLGGLNGERGDLKIYDSEGIEKASLGVNGNGFGNISVDSLENVRNVIYATHSGHPNYTSGTIKVYVDADNGNDNAVGTVDDPVASIQTAVDRIPKYLFHDAYVFVMPGVYVENVKIAGFQGVRSFQLSSHMPNVRYIREQMNGSTSNTGEHWVEIQAIESASRDTVSSGKPVSVTMGDSSDDPYLLTDGDTQYGNYFNVGGSPSEVELDLGTTYNLDTIKRWHYWNGGRTYHGMIVRVSEDGSNWNTVYTHAELGGYSESKYGHVVAPYIKGTLEVWNTDYIEIQDLYVDSSATDNPSIKVAYSNAKINRVFQFGSGNNSYGFYGYTSNVRLRDSEFTNNDTACIISAYSAQVDVTNCKGGNSKYGLYAYTSSVIAGTGDAPTGTSSNTRDAFGGQLTGSWTHVAGQYASQPITEKTLKETFTNTDSGSWTEKYGTWDSTAGSDVLQGKWDTYGRYKGLWFFGNDIYNALQASDVQSVDKVRVYISRASTSGYSSDVTHVIRSHSYSSQPSGEPTVSSEYELHDLAHGESAWIDLPSAMVTDFANGAKGIGIYTSSTSNSRYSRMIGDATVEVTYTVSQ